MENIKIDRETMISQLLASWADHYEIMEEDDLISEYRQYISEDHDYAVIIELEA